MKFGVYAFYLPLPPLLSSLPVSLPTYLPLTALRVWRMLAVLQRLGNAYGFYQLTFYVFSADVQYCKGRYTNTSLRLCDCEHTKLMVS